MANIFLFVFWSTIILCSIISILKVMDAISSSAERKGFKKRLMDEFGEYDFTVCGSGKTKIAYLPQSDCLVAHYNDNDIEYIYPENIEDVVIEQDRQDIVKTSLPSAVGRGVVGGVLLGGVGAVIGVATSSKVVTGKCSNVAIRIYTNDGKRPLVCELLNNGFSDEYSIDSNEYQKAYKQAVYLSDVLTGRPLVKI